MSDTERAESYLDHSNGFVPSTLQIREGSNYSYPFSLGRVKLPERLPLSIKNSRKISVIAYSPISVRGILGELFLYYDQHLQSAADYTLISPYGDPKEVMVIKGHKDDYYEQVPLMIGTQFTVSSIAEVMELRRNFLETTVRRKIYYLECMHHEDSPRDDEKLFTLKKELEKKGTTLVNSRQMYDIYNDSVGLVLPYNPRQFSRIKMRVLPRDLAIRP